VFLAVNLKSFQNGMMDLSGVWTEFIDIIVDFLVLFIPKVI
jgi:hypothetical protein